MLPPAVSADPFLTSSSGSDAVAFEPQCQCSESATAPTPDRK